MRGAQAAFVRGGSAPGQAQALEAQARVALSQGQAAPARALLDAACEAFAQCGWHDGEARVCVRLGDLDASEGRPQGGQGWYARALKLSRQNKPGDFSLGGLLGLAPIVHQQGRKLEALHLALVCERALALRVMPVSDPAFHAALETRCLEILARVTSKLMRSVVDEARAKLERGDVRVQLKECLEKDWV